MLWQWDKRIVNQESDVPSIIFFSWFHAKFFAKILSIIFFIFYKITKLKIKNFEFPKTIKSIKESNLSKIRLLVDNLLVPWSKQPSVIYWRLTDFTLIQISAIKGIRPMYFFLNMFTLLREVKFKNITSINFLMGTWFCWNLVSILNCLW